MKRILLLLPLLLLQTSSHADDAGLMRCRGIADPMARLACYDALVPAPAASGSSQARKMPQPTQPPAQTPRGQTTFQDAPPPPTEQFGMERKAPAAQVDRVESRITGRFEGWEPRQQIALDNGQVWQVIDDSRRVMFLNDPKATVRRGALGAYYLELEGSNYTARVQRLK